MKSSHADKKQLEKEAEQISKKQGEEFGKAFEKLTESMFIEGKTPQSTLEINNEILENMYAQAYRLYNSGKYKEATHLFRMLIMMNSLESKYVLGLAACFHMLKEYKDAVQTYMLGLILDPNNPIPHYHSSDCYIKMNDPISAMLSLELAIKHSSDKDEFSKIKERAVLSLENLKHQIEENKKTI